MNIKIESDVPLPKINHWTSADNKAFQDAIAALEVGQSFIIERKKAGPAYARAKTAYPDREFATRTVDKEKGLTRLWRLK